MNNVFIICEFNPFHYGHRYLLKYARESFPDRRTVCIMGGNFSQRGEACICDKYTRARTAVENGADLVLLLPSVYSCAPGPDFAYGGICICNALAEEGDILLFGSECGSTEALKTAAERLDALDFDPGISDGVPFAVRRERLYAEKYGDSTVITSANNILGMEYLRAIKQTSSPLTPHTFMRSPYFESATSIRSKPDIFPSVPELCAEIYRQDPYFGAHMKYGERHILGTLRNLKGCEGISQCGGGLGERIIAQSRLSTGYDELITLCKTKKYPDSRIRRGILSLMLNITAEERSADPVFTVLLAGKADSMSLLKTARIEVITKPSAHTLPEFLRECEFDALYSLLSPRMREEKYYLRMTPCVYN